MRLVVALVVVLSGAAAAAEDAFTVEGACRDGRPHGAYELKVNGKPRVAGAFNRGKRTGSFIYWTAAGVRVAHIPYDDDLLSGTVATWYPGPVVKGSTPQKLEAGYSRGRRNGVTRSWHPEGRPRAEYDYVDGRLAAASAWNARGEPLPEAEARALAERDARADLETFRSYESLVGAHLPGCRAPSPRPERP